MALTAQQRAALALTIYGAVQAAGGDQTDLDAAVQLIRTYLGLLAQKAQWNLNEVPLGLPAV